MEHFDVVVVGGGAAGFFGAITAAETNPELKICILEGSSKLLSKVLISGGGRCNVTHDCDEAEKLIKHYPRGLERLLPAFKKFHCPDTVKWFEDRGVRLKTESDGRMFPVTDRSETIANCLIQSADELGIEVRLKQRVRDIQSSVDGYLIKTEKTEITTRSVLVATGGTPAMWGILGQLGLNIIPAVPSLFTFESTSPILEDLAGISFPSVQLKTGTDIYAQEPILITHKGLSGPAVLWLSAFGARRMHEKSYHFDVEVNWVEKSSAEVRSEIGMYAEVNPKQYVIKNPMFGLPRRFWIRLCELAGITENRNWAETGKKQLNPLIQMITASKISVHGKSTFKEEFVTAGGVDLDEVDLTTFECKKFPGLFVAGECLDIDAVTGGFNFQGAWTTGYLAGREMASFKEVG